MGNHLPSSSTRLVIRELVPEPDTTPTLLRRHKTAEESPLCDATSRAAKAVTALVTVGETWRFYWGFRSKSLNCSGKSVFRRSHSSRFLYSGVGLCLPALHVSINVQTVDDPSLAYLTRMTESSRLLGLGDFQFVR
jgi:hypothetical protein